MKMGSGPHTRIACLLNVKDMFIDALEFFFSSFLEWIPEIKIEKKILIIL